jgi:hypothetical protein
MVMDVDISVASVNVPCRCGICVQSRSVMRERNFSGAIDLTTKRSLPTWPPFD